MSTMPRFLGVWLEGVRLVAGFRLKVTSGLDPVLVRNLGGAVSSSMKPEPHRAQAHCSRFTPTFAVH